MAGETLQIWMDDVTEKTGGAIRFEVHWGGAMGAPAEHIDLVRSGTVDMAFSSATYSPGRTPLDNIEYVFPFGPRDPVIVVQAKERLREEFPEIAADYAKENIVQLFNSVTTEYHMMSRQPINSVDDLRGKNVSLIGEYFGQWVDAIGSSSVMAPAAERYTMLQTGVVDVDALAIDLSLSYSLHEVAPYFIEVGLLTAAPYHFWINQDVFNSLPADVQQIMIEAGQRAQMYSATDQFPAWTDRVFNAWREAGVNFFKLPDDQRAAWAAQVPDTPAQWAADMTERGYPGWEMVQRYQEISAELGYEWPRQWGER